MKLDVLLPLKFDHPFTYSVPKEMNLSIGDFVQVSFRNKDVIGVVWKEGSVLKNTIKIKNIKKKNKLSFAY